MKKELWKVSAKNMVIAEEKLLLKERRFIGGRGCRTRELLKDGRDLG